MNDEILDIVDENDNVVSQASKEEVYEKKHPHRIIHIFIFNDHGEMALQLRSKEKSYLPHHWSTAVGGHVQAGESYEDAALREFEEELGVKTPITLIFSDIYKDNRGYTKFLSTFRANYNGPFEVEPKEVEKVQFFKENEIREMIKNNERFHPELLFLLKKYFNI